MRNHKESGNRQQFIRMQGPTMAAMAETTATATSNTLEANGTETAAAATEATGAALDNTVAVAVATLTAPAQPDSESDKGKIMGLPVALKSSVISAAKDNNGNHNSNSNTSTLAYLSPRRHQFTPDASNASFSSVSVAGSIQDDMHDQCGLTQAGLEEYNIRSSSYYDQTFHHQKQASYAQSEGYHSYVSSSDSTSATPFLDKLRQESDLLSRHSHHWSENDLSSVCSNSVAPSPIPLLSSLNGRGGSAVGGVGGVGSLKHNAHSTSSNHNSSESTSSTETLKWLGSMSDVSEASHATGYSAVAESVSSSQLIVHSSRVLTPKRHHSESVLYLLDNEPNSSSGMGALPSSPVASAKHAPQISEDGSSSSSRGQTQTPALRAQHRHSPSYPPVHTSMALHHFQASHQPQPHSHSHKFTQLRRLEATQSSLPDIQQSRVANETRATLGQSQSTGDLQQQQQQRPAQLQQHKSSISVTIFNSEAVVTIAPQPPPSKPQLSKTEALSSSAPNVGEMPASSSGNNDSYRSNHRLFPVSTYTEPVHSNTSQYVHHPKPQYSSGLHKSGKLPQTKLPVITPAGAAVQPTWHSVAERINDFERSNSNVGDLPLEVTAQQAQKYTYLEPSKTHRLSNPALKALQKNAVQSYFERQQQQQKETQLTTAEKQLLRPHSYQSLHAARDSLEQQQQQQQSLRKSLPNNLGPIPMLGIPTTAGSSSPTQMPRLDCSPKPPVHAKPPSPVPPPPPPRSRSLLPNLLRRSSSASDYADFRDQYQRATQDNLQRQSIKNISSAEKLSFNDCGMPPPPPPPRGRVALPARRTSSASEYAPIREKLLLQHAAALAHQQHHPQQHTQTARLAYYQQQQQPAAATSGNNWAPERPPKNPSLRVPSPELPPPPPTGNELDTSYTFDEPLPPPPPPEVLQPKRPASPNRRKTFAGASLRRSNYNNHNRTSPMATEQTPKVPPLVPKKPTSLLQSSRSSAQPQTNKLLTNANATKSRKRPHNPPPIMEHPTLDKSAVPPPQAPPLLPRARSTADNVIANNLESNQQKQSNSKASYLPRQSLEKLNNTDPDHGIYKLTLTSNEDLVAHNKPSYELLPPVGSGGVGKLPNNLPDVLPLGVKLQQQPKPLPGQPSSPNGLGLANDVPLRYGSNNNLATNSPTPYAMIYQTATPAPPPPPTMLQQRYSTPSLSTYKSKSPLGHVQHYTRSQSFDLNQHAQQQSSSASSPTQFMSQSHVDLKPTAFELEPTLEEVLPLPVADTPSRLSPSQSECSLSSSGNASSMEWNSSNNAEEHIFRAEVISTTLSTPLKPPVNRQESLRENIEKITQLQSKLMSAHICDTGLLGGVNYAPGKLTRPNSTQPPVTDTNEQCLASKPIESNETPQHSNEEPSSTPITQMDVATDGLKLVQRSEIILRVHPTTAEIACQTDELLDCDLGRLALHGAREEQQTRPTLQPRQRQAIEVDYENLAKELIKLLAPNDKLIEILTPKIYKPTTEYVSNLYNPNVPLRPSKRDVGTSTLMRMKTTSATAESKLITVELQITDLDSVLLNGSGDAECSNVIKQKLNELIKQLNQKIGVLKREKQTIAEECSVNDKVGIDLLAKLKEKVRPSEASKFRTYIDDVGHITSLLLSLSERLAQTECSLKAHAQGSDQEKTKTTLKTKRERLYEQLEEAKRLKADIDRRGSSIATLFGKHLSADECADYDYFINMKAKLIADSRDLADKIKCSEEQLGALRDALVQSDC